MKSNKPKASHSKGAKIQAAHDNKRTARLSIMIRDDVSQRMRVHCAQEKMKLAQVIEEALDMYLNQAGAKGKGGK